MAATIVAIATTTAAVALVAHSHGGATRRHLAAAEAKRPAARAPTTTLPPTTAAPTTTLPSTTRALKLVSTLTGDISPKSVVASGSGYVFAQNMMYKHTITVYDGNGALVKTIPDAVRLADFGVADRTATYQGAPVEAAFTADHRFAYVSNYSMYGPGFGHQGDDTCSPASGIDSSYVYRVNIATLAIDQVVAVGSVPKFVAVTPDGRFVLVSNWCSYDESIIDTASGKEVTRIALGAYPRGIAVDPQSKTAYVAVMGSHDVAAIDLASFAVNWIRNVGAAPRHVVIDPSGANLYVTLNAEGQVAKVDLAAGAVVAKAPTGSEPRSMTIAPDGQSLYVVNYNSNTVSKLAAADLHVLQTESTPSHPIGITFEPTQSRVWVACYSGSILVYDDA